MKKINLKQLYEELFGNYGSQGWWPTIPIGGSHPKYYPGQIPRKLSEDEQWEIIVGALLTQNTTWSNVEKALTALHSEGLISIESISCLPVHHLAMLIRPSGYYNQKAKRLQHIAGYILKNFGDVKTFFEVSTYYLREKLLELPGIGNETADSILLVRLQG